MAHNIETMFSAGRVKPWHYAETSEVTKLIQEAPTSKDALHYAGLDWMVEQTPVYMEDGVMIPNYKANVRSTDKSCLGIVTDRYKIVQNKEGQLDFMIAQNGRNLSGGQRQRLTIARALVRKPEILILDDSSSALDYVTDAKLRKALQEMEEKPTIFIVSQRTVSIQHADLILVLDDGVMVGMGTHEELLETCETYQEIYASQFKKEV